MEKRDKKGKNEKRWKTKPKMSDRLRKALP